MTNSYMLYCNLPAKCAQSIVPETAGPSRMSWVLLRVCLFVGGRDGHCSHHGRVLFTPIHRLELVRSRS